MPKNILFCADGTWNGPDQDDNDDKSADPTNVFKLFMNLDGVDVAGSYRLANEQERALRAGDGTLLQIAKYLHGVGDSDNFLAKILGGTLGAGIITRIVRGYTFISRNYEAGDRIYIVGFSRGAYTARALAGLIAAKGLLDARTNNLDDMDQAYRLGAAVWYDFRQNAVKSRRNLLGALQELVTDLPGFVSKPPTVNLVPDIEIEAVAVWDTVGSLGIPTYASNDRVDIFRFADTQLSAKVRHGLHAVSIDEERGDFVPTLWDPDPRIVQVLVPGAHADVGGGYAQVDDQCGLSDWALAWMTESLAELSVVFSDPPAISYAPNAKGCAHMPWGHLPWKFLEKTPRMFPDGLCLSSAALIRCATDEVLNDYGGKALRYAPPRIFPQYFDSHGAPSVGVKVVYLKGEK